MSIQSEIDRITQNVANTYTSLEALGADMPVERTSDNLSTTAETVKAVLYIEQTLTDEQKARVRENIGVGEAAKWELLWENAAPDASFAAQTITIDGLINYNLFIITSRVSSSNNMRFSTVCYRPELDARKVDLVRFDGSAGAWGSWERDITINRTNGTIQVDSGLYSYSGSSTISSNVAVPITILGTMV